MTAPAYTTDLTDLTDAESGTWGMFSGWTNGDNPSAETDYFIQGNGCYSSDMDSKSGMSSGGFDAGSDQSGSFNTGDCVFIWHVLLPGNAMDTYVNGGLRAVIGADLNNYTWWPVGGKDKGRNPYGGWQCYAVDPTNVNGTAVGSGHGGSYRWFGAAASALVAIKKGSPHGWDAMRYGRGEIKVMGGTDSSADHCTFVGMAAANDSQNNKWGLFQEQGGAYLWKGLMSIGAIGDSSTGTVPVDFYDSNRVIFIDDTPVTYPDFNKIEINDEDSIVTWISISFIALGTYAPGNFEVVDNADVNLEGCSFTDMGTFIFKSNSSVLNCIFRGCNQITANGADMTGTKILIPNISEEDSSSASPETAALIWNVATNPDGYLDNMTFSIGDEPHHAIEFGTLSPTSMTLRGMTTIGFSASNNAEGSTFHIKRTSGTVTINVVGGTGNFTYKSEGATVVINTGKTLTLRGIEYGSEVTIVKTGQDSSAAVVHHEETIDSTGETVYSYDAGMQGEGVDILIMNLDFEPFLMENYILPTSNTELPISQVADRVYANP